MDLEIGIKYKLPRPITPDDRFYIVSATLDDGSKVLCGWIEKTFCERDFIKNFPIKGMSVVTINKVTEHRDRKEYGFKKMLFGIP